MRSIYGTLNGACDCDGLGIYDDLFSGIDEALSEDRQKTVWGKFDNNFMPRIKPGKAKLLGIGTRKKEFYKKTWYWCCIGCIVYCCLPP